jgi:hypothetical protein
VTPTAIAKVIDQIDALGADDKNAAPSSTAARHCSELCDLLVEAGGGSRPDVLNWLLTSSHGRSLFLRSLGKRLDRHKTKEAAMPREKFMASVVKEYGAVAIAKHILATASTNITEWEFVKACGPDFVKLYTDPGEDGLTLRKALTLIKNAAWAAKAERGMPTHAPQVDINVVTLEPRVTGGDAATRSADGSDGTAYAQLMALAEEQRRKAPFMTPEQAFAAVYTDTKNIELVNRERFESRRRGTDAYPGWPA